jgi:hypothetical protein
MAPDFPIKTALGTGPFSLLRYAIVEAADGGVNLTAARLGARSRGGFPPEGDEAAALVS